MGWSFTVTRNVPNKWAVSVGAAGDGLVERRGGVGLVSMGGDEATASPGWGIVSPTGGAASTTSESAAGGAGKFTTVGVICGSSEGRSSGRSGSVVFGIGGLRRPNHPIKL